MLKIKRVNVEIIEPLPQGSITEPWDTAIQNIQSKFLRLGKVSDETELITQILEGEWSIFLRWVYKKKWNRSHKIPRQKAYANCEPMGDVLLAILNLCIEVHAVHPMSKHYPNAAAWFDAICWEIKYSELCGRINQSGGKKKYLNYLRKKVIDCYKYRENPHNPDTEPHIYRLIQSVEEINRSGMLPDLVKTYWGGLTKALQTFATHNDKTNFAYTERDGNNIFVRSGNSRFLLPQDFIANAVV